MKKLLIFALVALGMLACKDKNNPEENTISVDPSSKKVETSGGEFTVTVVSTAAWSATVNQSWVTINPNSGQGDEYVSIKVASGEAGTAKVLFSNGDATATLTITRGEGGGESESKEGLLPGKFSVSTSKQVQFSKGNLQYQAGTNTWRFATHQYDTIGALNANISSTYDGWIDLFGWGTGNNPTLVSNDNNNYATFTDWGVNKISNGGNKANMWRTLTDDEGTYLFQTRTNATNLCGQATVAGVHGFVFLPDNWITPSSLTWQGMPNNWTTNQYSASDWLAMEKAGAVFLPATGYRYGTVLDMVGMDSGYWSSTPAEGHDDLAHYFYFFAELAYPAGRARCLGMSVRLVRDVK